MQHDASGCMSWVRYITQSDVALSLFQPFFYPHTRFCQAWEDDYSKGGVGRGDN